MMQCEQDVFVHLSGQDDNLGDSALRVAYLNALRGENRRFHIYFGDQTSDYTSAFPRDRSDVVYASRSAWIEASASRPRQIHVFNAGEINPRDGEFPTANRAEELARIAATGGTIIVAGFGIKDPSAPIKFAPALRKASIVSWRDHGSRAAAGFGDVAPDWAYALGTPTSRWAPPDERPFLAVTLRYDRAWPDSSWREAVRALASRTSTRIVTMAQVARDAPRAARLAEALGGEYLPPRSMDHPTLDAYARDIFSRSLAVVSDRAHGLIIGATEGAWPIGSAADPQKISRLLDVVGLNATVGRYGQLEQLTADFVYRRTVLMRSIDEARLEVATLTRRINETIRAAG